MPGDREVRAITSARRPLSEDVATRTRRYLISMGIRTVCFVAAVLLSGWARWAAVAAAVVLPYVAVVFANAGRERGEIPSTLVEPPQLPPGPAAAQVPADDGAEGTTDEAKGGTS